MPESVDAAKRSLYKGGHGGGRKSRRRCSLSGAGEVLICVLPVAVCIFAFSVLLRQRQSQRRQKQPAASIM
jgi:hypothetical protein